MSMPYTLRRAVTAAAVITTGSHVFCCVLPSVFSMLSLMVGVGMIGSLPIALTQFHDVLHAYEVYILVFSACMLGLGWGIDIYSRRIDCHDTGCGHGPCKPRKNKAHKILLIATALFVINMAVFAFTHFDNGQIQSCDDPTHTHDHHVGHQH